MSTPKKKPKPRRARKSASSRVGRNRSDLPLGVENPNAFALWMRDKGLSVEAVAKLLDVGESAVYGYRRGDRPPGLKTATRIEKVTNGEVAAGSWED